jgi:hypothetical protein
MRTLSSDIDGYYSLIIDESTDISVLKMLGIAIRYYSKEQQRIICTFLNLVHIQDGTADVIVDGIKETLKTFKLKEDVPDLVMVKCVCHSLQLAVSKASEKTLPRNMEFLIRETYNWFSHSSIKQVAYQQIYSLINDGKLPLKILQVANTRWLSMEPAIKRILDQWDSLKAHFDIAPTKDNCYTAELLFNMFSDVNNKIYLTFIYDIVQLVQKTNKIFESRSADPTKLLQDLKQLYVNIVSKIVTPGRLHRIDLLNDNFENYIDPNPYLGFAFENSCTQISATDKSTIKSRCISFLTQLSKELRNRLPDNIKILEKMNLFAVDQCLKHNKQPITDVVKEFTNDVFEISNIENQWGQIHLVQWQEIQNTEKFWVEVSNYRDASNENPFDSLVKVAFKVLCLPHSNADIERVFSSMNLIKNKLRNRMKLPLLNSLLNTYILDSD